MTGAVSIFVRKKLIELLNERRIVVWYDGESDFTDFIGSFTAQNTFVVSAAESGLSARRRSDEVYRQINESTDTLANKNLLIYLPFFRGGNNLERQQDPFELYCCAGTVFGVDEGQKLESLARQAMPEQEEEIRRMFIEGRPNLSLMDGLREAERYPLLQNALSVEGSVEIAAVMLCNEKKIEKVIETAGVFEEFRRLAASEFGFRIEDKKKWDEFLDGFTVYLLFSEFVFDAGGGKPEALKAVPTAEKRYKSAIFRLCDRMRSDADFLQGYLERALRVENDLRLVEICKDIEDIGNRDTFPFEEKYYLKKLIDAAVSGDLKETEAVLNGRKTSVWKDLEDRKILWACAERCLDLLKAIVRVKPAVPKSGSVAECIDFYAADDGFSEVDRCQRLMESAVVAEAVEGEVARLVSHCRSEYSGSLEKLQKRFLTAVEAEGWPIEGRPYQTQIFQRFVAPLLEERHKTAYFLVDSLRYEMGRDLGKALRGTGETEVHAVLTVLPTTTRFGMAALMPKSEGTFRLKRDGDDFIPIIGETPLKESKDRMKFLKMEFGGRFTDISMNDLLSKPADSFRRRFQNIDFLVVRTPDPDVVGEQLGSRLARKYISDSVGDVAAAVRRLAALGFTRCVISADHGHVLIPEIPAGETISAPEGNWPLRKRRCLLGQSRTVAAGTVVFKGETVGIYGEPVELCVPKGYKVFTACEGYFHEGLSLQESIVPVVVVHVTVPESARVKREIILTYGKDSFTSRVIGVKVRLHGLLPEKIRVLVQAFAETPEGMKQVGEAADCPERDETTREIELETGKDVTVPVLIDQDFDGETVEIRVSDPGTGVIWRTLELKNKMIL